MTDMPTAANTVLPAYLRRFDEKLDRVIESQSEIKERVGLLEQQYAGLSRRIDTIEHRLARIEKRLDLIGA